MGRAAPVPSRARRRHAPARRGRDAGRAVGSLHATRRRRPQPRARSTDAAVLGQAASQARRLRGGTTTPARSSSAPAPSSRATAPSPTSWRTSPPTPAPGTRAPPSCAPSSPAPIPRTASTPTNSWHLASLELDLGRPAAALARYEGGVAPLVPRRPILFFGAAALLWRLELYGFGAARRARGRRAAVGRRPRRRAGSRRRRGARRPQRHRPGHGLHRLADDAQLAGLLERRLRRRAAGARRRRRRRAARPRAPRVLAGRLPRRARPHGPPDRLPLAPRRDTLDQLAVFEDTLIEAQLRAGRFAARQARLRRRLVPVPAPRDRYWLGRAKRGRTRTAAPSAAARLLGAAGRPRDAPRPLAPRGGLVRARRGGRPRPAHGGRLPRRGPRGSS